MAKVSLRAYNREIETMIDRGQLDEAIAHCQHILKTFPKHLETYRLLGKAFLESKRHGDAADIFLRILASSPSDFVAQVGMSIIRDEENKLDDAIWHMERAFETQPSNPAIQSELQRLYGRRDGVQPPRIRMTRGALAHMYVQGELYPQAISEVKSVLKDDQGRADMQALLARANYKSGLKNDAADVASAMLKRYPYSLDANRILADILGAERPENAQIYRQRVVELDPYAGQVAGTMFLSSEVPDAAVTLERLDWNGQPTSMQSDWGETKAIRLEGEASSGEQPDWLKNSFVEAPPPSQPTHASIFDTAASSQPSPAKPADDIPDFLKAAGWGQSTGSFDETKSAFADESPTTGSAQSIEQGDLPDWVKAMKPAEPEPAQEEELPDWINKIGTGALSSQPTEQSGWMDQPEQTSSTPASEESSDWLNQSGQMPSTPEVEESSDWTNPLSQASSTPVAGDQPDWLKDLGGETSPASTPVQSDEPDWLKGFGQESEITPQPAQTETPDWLKGIGGEPEPVPAQKSDELDWLDQFTSKPEPPVEQSAPDFEFLNKLTEEPVVQTPESPSSLAPGDSLGVSEKEQDDSFAWLEALAAKQGASEGLLTKPEERLEEEPEWVKQAKGLTTPPPPSIPVEPPIVQPAANVEELGKSEQEQDDSFAWLEALAAKQGASEGLLTKPEERLQEEPEWVKQAKGTTQQPPVSDMSNVMPPPTDIEELGKSEQEQDDSFAWLEALAAKQGASEGLLTKPEERLEEEPEWVKQAKSVPQPPPVTMTPEPEPEQPMAMDDTAAWLKSLDEEDKHPTSAPAMDETAVWLKGLDKEESSTVEPSGEMDMPAWMKNLDEEETLAAGFVAPTKGTPQKSQWKPMGEEPVEEEQRLEEESMPSWLADLEKEEVTPISADDDLPSWLRNEEPVAESPEPTRPSDWKPAEEEQPKVVYSPPIEEPKQPEIIYSPPLEESEQTETESFEAPREEQVEDVQETPVVPPREEPKPEPKPVRKAPVKPVPPETPRESVTRKGTGMLNMPGIDPMLGVARNELSRSNIPGALESYGKLIKKGRYLDEVIYDLREALYRYPVEVSIWQSLGDAYMRANRLQDALDAYTKAEELLR